MYFVYINTVGTGKAPNLDTVLSTVAVWVDTGLTEIEQSLRDWAAKAQLGDGCHFDEFTVIRITDNW